MARYIGPKTKIARRYNEPIFGENKFTHKKQYKRVYRGKRFKKNDYISQLFEKQKLKYIYGILERQCRKIFKRASSIKGNTGDIFLQLLERRLDNVIYRLGISTSRSGARQLVCHGHIKVNAHIVNIPSYYLKPGDIIEIAEKSKSHNAIKQALSSIKVPIVSWLSWNKEKMLGTFQHLPNRNNIPENINDQLIVEWYSK
ncbi:30S ribosomal protein S4 [Candidatus Uzinura diaspidicola str. ASNER]|uniref:Small ribosomal subunit protein uS4 n=1 Tax=Candidatus Uzinura diaspidicola str. ASNER TaxID=1133592 RepID=L7VG40_9FLAO|nr:30S ribosomal protein S4 [Candidatus Uzinura diaspidicola str. ASNER]